MRYIILGTLLLAGCTTPHLVHGTEAGGIIGSFGWQPGKSLKVAQEHCEKYGRSARVTSQNDLHDNMTFDCV